MFGHFNPYELAAIVRDKTRVYRQEAAVQGQLQRHPLRNRLAKLLRAWAETLEPSAQRPHPGQPLPNG